MWSCKYKEYYHGDHLGSSNVITDRRGRSYEHIEYFPYGETWVDEQRNQTNLPYRFTGKELDPETGMYYYGARYYDPRISRWISADPALVEYLPYRAIENDQSLPGMGGIYAPININLYRYASLNPLRIIDPDGKSDYYYEDGNYSLMWMMTVTKYLCMILMLKGCKMKGLTQEQSDIFNEFVGTVKEESSGDLEESKGIADVVVNRSEYTGRSVENILRKTGIYGNKKGRKLGNTARSSADKRIENARAAVLDAFLGVTDESGGAYFWEGLAFIDDKKRFFGIENSKKPPTFIEIKRIGRDVSKNRGTVFMKYNPKSPEFGKRTYP